MSVILAFYGHKSIMFQVLIIYFYNMMNHKLVSNMLLQQEYFICFILKGI